MFALDNDSMPPLVEMIERIIEPMPMELKLDHRNALQARR
jgi:hypothetical protein